MAKLYIGDKFFTPAIVNTKDILVPVKRFGATVDTWIGNLDENGVLSKPTTPTALDFDGVTEVAAEGLFYTFNNNAGISTVKFDSLVVVRNSGLMYCFNKCQSLTEASFDSLTTIEEDGCYGIFYLCPNLASVNLRSLTTIGNSGLYYAFRETSITTINFESLESVSERGLQAAFYNTKTLTSVYFPKLTSFEQYCFGNSSANYTFSYCTALTEIHFKSDAQTSVENLVGYPNKFGATNATIYFDL